MNKLPFLRPTALQHMRGFLAQSGAELPPWTTSDEVMDELVSLLHLHRGNDAFFARLVPFVQELRDHAARGAAGLTSMDAEVLSRSTVEALVAELQARLQTATRSASARIVPALLGQRACRLLCLALLSSGLAACTQRPADGGAGEPGTPNPLATTPSNEPGAVSPPARAQPAGAEPASAEPGTPPPVLPKPSDGSADALVELFRSKPPQEAVKVLEQILDAGAATPDAARPAKPRPAVDPTSVPVYKGILLS